MSAHPRLSDDLITRVLRMRSGDPDLALLDNIVRTVGTTAQDRPWLPLGQWSVPRRTLLIFATALLLAATGAIAVGARLLLPDPIQLERMTVIGQVVDAINGRDGQLLNSSFAPDGSVTLRQVAMDGSFEMAHAWPVHTGILVGSWTETAEAWDLEAELRSCRSVSDSTVRCAVATRWHVLQVEIAEEWVFAYDGIRLASLETIRLDQDPPDRRLPLGYGDLKSWESWLEATHPEQAARLLGGDWRYGQFFFRYQPFLASDIAASIQEYLESRTNELRP